MHLEMLLLRKCVGEKSVQTVMKEFLFQFSGLRQHNKSCSLQGLDKVFLIFNIQTIKGKHNMSIISVWE